MHGQHNIKLNHGYLTGGGGWQFPKKIESISAVRIQEKSHILYTMDLKIPGFRAREGVIS